METFWKKAGKVLVLVCLLVLLSATTVFAKPTAKVTFSGGGEVSGGSDISVQVQLNGEVKFSETDLFITYDPAVIEFVSGDVDSTTPGKVRLRGLHTGGSSEATWNLQFRALAEGETSLSAVDVWVKNADADAAGSDTSGIEVTQTKIKVHGSAAPTQMQDVAAAAQQSSLAEQIANDGTMSALVNDTKWMVKEFFADELLPPYFEASSQFYKGVEVKAAKLNNAEYYLLYLESEDGTRNKFCAYDSTTKTFTDISKLEPNAAQLLYLTTPAETPAGFVPATMVIGEFHFPAWQLPGAENAYAANASEFYLFYGYNQAGYLGWYVYDTTFGSIQRYTDFSLQAETQDEPLTDEEIDVRKEYNQLVARFDFLIQCIKYVVVALMALLLLLLIVNLTDHGSRNDRDEEEEDDEEYEEEEPRKLSRKERKELKRQEKKARKQAKEEEWEEQHWEDEELDDFDSDDQEEVTDEYVDDYEEEEKPKLSKEEQEAVGVLKPVQKPEEEEQQPEASKKEQSVNQEVQAVEVSEEKKASVKKSDQFGMTASIQELSKHIQKAMEEEEPAVTDEELGDLTFVDIDE